MMVDNAWVASVTETEIIKALSLKVGTISIVTFVQTEISQVNFLVKLSTSLLIVSLPFLLQIALVKLLTKVFLPLFLI